MLCISAAVRVPIDMCETGAKFNWKWPSRPQRHDHTRRERPVQVARMLLNTAGAATAFKNVVGCRIAHLAHTG
jgi:hypothetical protein